MAADKESRKHGRIDVRWPIQTFEDESKIEGETKNISESGVLISMVKPLRLYQEYRISILLPNHSRLELGGKVIWSDLYGIASDDQVYGVGLCFVKVSEKDCEILYRAATEHPAA